MSTSKRETKGVLSFNFSFSRILQLIEYCPQLSGVAGLPSYSLDSVSVNGGAMTGEPIVLKKMKSDVRITARFDVQVQREGDFNKYNPIVNICIFTFEISCGILYNLIIKFIVL